MPVDVGYGRPWIDQWRPGHAVDTMVSMQQAELTLWGIVEEPTSPAMVLCLK